MRLPTVVICTTAAFIQYNTLSAGAVSNLPPPESGLEASNFVVNPAPGRENEKSLVETRFIASHPLSTGSELPVQSVAPPAAQVAPKLEQKVAQASPQPLADVRGYWAQSFIEPLVARGVMSAFSDGTFRPDAPLTRAQFAAIIQKAFQKSPIRSAVQFADVPASHPAYSAIQAAYQMGFMGGNSNNLFNPEQNISRTEALVALVAGLNLKPAKVSPTSLNSYFEDAASVPEYARNSIAAALENRMVVNYPNVRVLNPSRVATRGEVAAFVYQALVSSGLLPALTPSAVASKPQSQSSTPQPPAPPEWGAGVSTIPVSTRQPAPPEWGAGGVTAISVSPPQPALQPTISAIVAQQGEYTLGAGDRIRLDIVNVSEYSGEYQILVNGSLNLPLIGKVSVQGMTLEQAAAVISQRYTPFIRTPISTLTLVAPRPLKVAISGEINRPGSYTISLTGTPDGKGGLQFPTVTQAIQMAGGITQAASLRQVRVRRPQRSGSEQIIGVDLWALLQGGDVRQDLALQDGDSIFIPTAPSPNLAEASRLASASFAAPKTEPINIAVVGEVSKPGSYTVKPSDAGERPTVTRALQAAGGITPSADLRRVAIRRPTQAGGEQIIALDLWRLLREGDLQQDTILQSGDTIIIPTVSVVNLAESSQLAAANFAAAKSQPLNVAVIGEVARPGTHVVKADKDGELPTVTRALQVAGGITQSADIRQIRVRRITREGSEQTFNVNLWELLQAGDLRQDAILQEGDTIVIPTATALNPQEAPQLAAASFSPDKMTVNVVGEVVKPGSVEVPPNTPLNQALLAAGGFNNRARKGKVELIRLNPNGTVSKRGVEVDFKEGINEKSNPTLRPNDVIVVGKSGLASVSDTVGDLLNPLGKILPLLLLF
jgi:polysaccharide export outer membrane protein